MAASCHAARSYLHSPLSADHLQCRENVFRQIAERVSFGVALTPFSQRKRQSLQIRNVGWDPEGILAPPVGNHITRRKVMKDWAKDAEAKEKAMAEARKELERRAAVRDARVIPDSNHALVEYLLDTETQEMEFEIAKCRKRLDDQFFSDLRTEVGSLKFAVDQSEATKDRIAELEVLEKALNEGIAAYDKLTSDMISAKDRLTKLLTAKDKKAMLLEMAGDDELDRPLLALLDENTARAREAGQEQAADFMEKVRTAVLKYLTV